MDYKNGKIYTIRSHQTDKIYIGSTTQPLSKRLSAHKAHFRAYLDGKYNNVTSFEIIKYGDAYIELLEEYPCETKDQLHKKEGGCIRSEPNCVNKCVAGRTTKQYKEEHKDFYKTYNHSYYKDNIEQKKQYYKDNTEYLIKRQTSYNKDHIEQIKDYGKKYYEINVDKIKTRTKQYYEINADKIKARTKKYRELNRDKIKEYQNKYREQKKMEENILT